MAKYKSKLRNIIEYLLLACVILFIIINAICRQDSYIAVISAICGITYTFLAGKGLPVCYLFGVTGSSFYSLLSFQNALWGNLLLYAGYYVPMQIIGYFSWKKNLKDSQNEIVKIRLPKTELFVLLGILFFLSLLVYFILFKLNDAHPVLDSVTTVFSIGGMYLTVRRAIEQWIFWFIVNLLSVVMWFNVALSGVKVYSTVIMWAVYLLLAVYFYYSWKKEVSLDD